MTMQTQYAHDETKRRYTATREGKEVGRIVYSPAGDKVLAFKHVVVDPEYRGQGIAQEMLAFAMADVIQKGIRVIPICPFVRKVFDENEAYRQHEAPAKRIGFIVGSLRKGSFSRKMAKQMATMLPEGYAGELVDIGQLPLYNQDFDEEGAPESYAAFRDTIKSLDGLIIVTPEYNRGTSAVLKNALDVASRPYGQNKWGGKPTMVVGVTPGALGAMAGVIDVRKSLSFLNVPVMGQPEAYISNAGELFNDDGTFIKPDTQAFVQKLVDAYVRFHKKS